MAIADIRREYNLTGLRRKDLHPDPIVQFKAWFDQATGARASGRLRKFFVKLYKSLLMIGGAELLDLNAMTLATADAEGRPSARVVLLKGLDERGFVFYTNYNSRKGRELADNPNAALVFYWPDQEREVTVAGTVSPLPPAESDAYFKSRPRGSRIGAWASDQSAVVRDRVELEAKWAEFERQFPGEEVPRPSHWGGYVLAPARLEFWQGRPNRLHDRFRYTRQPEGNWLIERLSP
jgi:pyridoxamine 5'-phosphate oxidase